MYSITIKRRKRDSVISYTETFFYEEENSSDTVAKALRRLNSLEVLKTSDGKKTDKISWESSCMQKKCGACAMIINKRPMLACAAVLKDLGPVITLEPLRKFPVVCDLLVNRQILYDNLKEMKLYLKEKAELLNKDVTLAHDASRCLQCGLCLEVCPNFCNDGVFFGMHSVAITTKILAELPKDKREEIAKKFDEHVFEGCGKSLSCKNICPVGLKTDELLVNSVALAIFKRR